jgi:hypothetical protein
MTKKGTLCRKSYTCNAHKHMYFNLPITSIPFNVLEMIHRLIGAKHQIMLRMCSLSTHNLPRPSIVYSPVYNRLERYLSKAEVALSNLDSINGRWVPASIFVGYSHAFRVAHRKILDLRKKPSVHNVGCHMFKRLKEYEDKRHQILLSFTL